MPFKKAPRRQMLSLRKSERKCDLSEVMMAQSKLNEVIDTL